MAVTVVGTPDIFTPVYNPIFFYMDSTNKNETGFKYVMDIYSANTQNKIGRYKLFPRPLDGYGVGDINQLLTSQVGYFFDQNFNFITGSTGSYLDYDVVFGEEYVKYWSFYDNSFYTSSDPAFSGKTMFYTLDASNTHNFVAGDFVLIQQDPGYTSTYYNGIFEVISASTTAIIVDLDHTVNTPANSGTAVYADQHKTVNMGETISITLGSEVVVNTNFSALTGWTQPSSIGPGGGTNQIVIGGGVMICFVSDYIGVFDSTSYNSGATISLIPGQDYLCQYDVLTVEYNGSTATTFPHSHNINLGGGFGTSNFGIGSFSEVITAGSTGTTTGVHFNITASAFSGSPTYAIVVDNVTVKPYSESITYDTIESGYTVFNGAIQHQDFISYTSSTYDLTSSSSKFLTDVPSGYRVKSDNSMWINFYSDQSAYYAYSAELVTRYGTYLSVNPVTANTTVQTIAIGPYNITQSNGTVLPTGIFWYNNPQPSYPIFKNMCWDYDTVVSGSAGTVIVSASDGTQFPLWNQFTIGSEYVDFYLNNILHQALITATPTTSSVQIVYPYSAFTAASNTSGTLFQITEYYDVRFNDPFNPSISTSETLHFNVDWNTTRYGNIELLFIDRLGSFIPANFELQSYKSINISRNEYQTFLGRLTGDKWNYQSIDRGRQNLNTTVKKQIDLISNWLTEEEAEFLQELYTSPVVFIKEFNQFWPVIVTSNSYAIQTKNNKKNIQIRITIEMANNDRIQNF